MNSLRILLRDIKGLAILSTKIEKPDMRFTIFSNDLSKTIILDQWSFDEFTNQIETSDSFRKIYSDYIKIDLIDPLEYSTSMDAIKKLTDETVFNFGLILNSLLSARPLSEDQYVGLILSSLTNINLHVVAQLSDELSKTGEGGMSPDEGIKKVFEGAVKALSVIRGTLNTSSSNCDCPIHKPVTH